VGNRHSPALITSIAPTKALKSGYWPRFTAFEVRTVALIFCLGDGPDTYVEELLSHGLAMVGHRFGVIVEQW
jgi:hypothetical protein